VELEICCNGLESALIAAEAGADRIELCTALHLGGLTPSVETLQSVREQIRIPVYVLIRPRSGDFVYSSKEFNTMLECVDFCISLGYDGIVSGVLSPNFTIDVERTAQLLAASKPLDFTFHRAFDEVINPELALAELEEIGVKRILSSGQEKSAADGLRLLQNLQSKSKQLVFMPGAGINRHNVLSFKKAGFSAVHASASKPMASDKPQNGQTVSDKEEIRAMLNIIKR
jgi:copper homeostasis protein